MISGRQWVSVLLTIRWRHAGLALYQNCNATTVAQVCSRCSSRTEGPPLDLSVKKFRMSSQVLILLSFGKKIKRCLKKKRVTCNFKYFPPRFPPFYLNRESTYILLIRQKLYRLR
jgi:hypothetical protein